MFPSSYLPVPEHLCYVRETARQGLGLVQMAFPILAEHHSALGREAGSGVLSGLHVQKTQVQL